MIASSHFSKNNIESFNSILEKLGDKYIEFIGSESNKKNYLAPFFEIAKLQSLFTTGVGSTSTYITAMESRIKRNLNKKMSENIFKGLQLTAFETAIEWMKNLPHFPDNPREQAIIVKITRYIVRAWPDIRNKLSDDTKDFFNNLNMLREFMGTTDAINTIGIEHTKIKTIKKKTPVKTGPMKTVPMKTTLVEEPSPIRIIKPIKFQSKRSRSPSFKKSRE